MTCYGIPSLSTLRLRADTLPHPLGKPRTRDTTKSTGIGPQETHTALNCTVGNTGAPHILRALSTFQEMR